MSISTEEKDRYLRETAIVLAQKDFRRAKLIPASFVSCLTVRRCAR